VTNDEMNRTPTEMLRRWLFACCAAARQDDRGRSPCRLIADVVAIRSSRKLCS